MASIASLKRHDKPLITDAWSWYSYAKEGADIEKRYNFTSRFDDELQLWKRDGDFIGIPRELCPTGEVDNRTDGVKVHFPKCPEPRPNQVEVFAETVEFLEAGNSGIVSAYTGWGKTVLGCYAAYKMGVKTLVITTKDDVYKQWYDSAKEFLGLPDHLVGEIRGNKCEVVGPIFCVGMIHSMSKEGKYPDDVIAMFADFGLIIFDEVHRLPADHFQACAGMFPGKLRLGLSANFKRIDGKEPLILAHVGNVKAKTTEELMVPKVIRVKTDWHCPRIYEKQKDGSKKLVVFPHKAGKTAHIEKLIAADGLRNDTIASILETCLDKGRKIACFSTTHEHLLAMARACVKRGMSKKDLGFYIGATTKAEKEHREKELTKPIIFTTFGMMGEGTDADWLDTAFLAMPRSNVMQPVGRVRREFEDKRFPLVFDFVDLDSPVFAGYALSREAWYKSIKCEVVDFEE